MKKIYDQYTRTIIETNNKWLIDGSRIMYEGKYTRFIPFSEFDEETQEELLNKCKLEKHNRVLEREIDEDLSMFMFWLYDWKNIDRWDKTTERSRDFIRSEIFDVRYR